MTSFEDEIQSNRKERRLNPRFEPVPLLCGIDEIKKDCEEYCEHGEAAYGIEILDDCVEGFHKGSVTYIIAAPNTGKSLFGLTIASNLAKQGKDVLICSCEMGAGLLMERQLNSLAGITKGQLNYMYKYQRDTAEKILDSVIVNDTYTWLQRIFVSETGGATVEDLLTMFDIYSEYEYIVIDYIQRIRGQGSEYEVITNAAREIQNYARATGRKFIVCSQAGRQSVLDAQTGKKIQTDRVRGKGSGSIEEDADVGLSLLQDNTAEDGERYILTTLFKNRYAYKKDITYKYKLDKRMALILCEKGC